LFIRKQDARAILERHEKTVPAEIAGVLPSIARCFAVAPPE